MAINNRLSSATSDADSADWLPATEITSGLSSLTWCTPKRIAAAKTAAAVVHELADCHPRTNADGAEIDVEA
jgi:hypothetical protein